MSLITRGLTDEGSRAGGAGYLTVNIPNVPRLQMPRDLSLIVLTHDSEPYGRVRAGGVIGSTIWLRAFVASTPTGRDVMTMVADGVVRGARLKVDWTGEVRLIDTKTGAGEALIGLDQDAIDQHRERLAALDRLSTLIH